MINRWGDLSLLKAINNPTSSIYTIIIKCPEVTFLGEKHQPDFGTLTITMIPDKKVIELKSIKQYIYSFRHCFLSYERFVNVVYNCLWEVYDPKSLTIEAEFKPRGGISSTVIINSQDNEAIL